MTFTREPSARRASQIGLDSIDPATDLAHDPLADMKQLRVVAEVDIGPLHLAADFNVDRVGAVDHDVGDVVAGEQGFEGAITEDIVADISEKIILLRNRHDDLFRPHDVGDDFSDRVACLDHIQFRQLRNVDRLDQCGENLALE